MREPVKISGVIITFNEEKNIGRCLNSLIGICDEILVVDSFSTDKTKDICIKYGAKFLEHRFDGHIEQKNYAMHQAQYDIILSLDADEALSDQLRESILELKSNWKSGAYKFNRFTNYCGQWIKHSGWYPDTKIRLWDRKLGLWGGTNPHDSVELIEGIQALHLKGDMLHYSYYTMEEHVLRSAKYAKISAKALYTQGKHSSIVKMITSATFRFIKDYFVRGGFRDGFYGLIICATSSHTTFLKYAYLRNLNKGNIIEQ